MMEKFNRNMVHVDSRGRFVIPAHLRQMLDIRSGETLVARISDGRLVLEKPERILDRLKTTFSNLPSDVSLVDELIAERRDQASRES
jgi:AbrB family looped-hinge helix DNA binding protein